MEDGWECNEDLGRGKWLARPVSPPKTTWHLLAPQFVFASDDYPRVLGAYATWNENMLTFQAQS